MGELSRRSGVSVPSIKYYLREGMLPAGERTGPNQADYGEDHVRRLRLVRALLDVGGLSVAAAKEVLAAVDGDVPLYEALGAAQDAVVTVPGGVSDEAAAEARAKVDGLVARRGWRVTEANPGRRAAADVLATYARLGWPQFGEAIDDYAAAMEQLAAREVESVLSGTDGGGRERAVEGAVTGTVLGGSLLLALRVMAQADASARLLGADPSDKFTTDS
ncbi:MerR family transcriptional regulator [Actinomycetospora sp. NBRC 106375]|uniref:MerR family transcriptional regulator n=1 Tax=Actinomycetospora sp. NBRC 106375 TaxID=3032207 RepID=UPI002554375A|nr:MerR family transcriptional regulator [Actinomycetospora sp. NBRC 106375]